MHREHTLYNHQSYYVIDVHPLKLTTQHHIENPLTQALLTEKFKSGDLIVVKCDKDDNLTFQVKN